MTYEYQPFPCWCTGPNGETQVFDREEDVPVGWTHHGVTVGAKLPQLDHDGDGRPGGSVSPPVSDGLKDLRKAYQDRFGKRPFMGWGADELQSRLAQ